MSLYGNIKRIGSQSFQFDRIYHSRKEMQTALESMLSTGEITDGVYPGRYVLVEYGERYSINKDTGERTEREEYQQNYQDDLNEYGNVYDSTVWQKIFTNTTEGQVEKYIMVAELNALAPQLELKEEEAAILKKNLSDSYTYTMIAAGTAFDPNKEYFILENDKYIKVNIKKFADGVTYYIGTLNELPLYYGDNNLRLFKGKEIEANKPYFDEIQDTELKYILHMPKPIQLEVNKTIDYHQQKFDIYHSYIDDESSGGNFIGWKPKISSDDVTIDDDTQTANLNNDAPFSTQELNMYLPAFGDALGALYDTLFGQANVNNGIRPYFLREGITEEDFDDDGSIKDVTKFADKADISKILKNHTYGLAGVLRSLFTDSTIPGDIRYYLSADWLAKNTDDDSNIPGILNKPKVVLGQQDIDSGSNYIQGQYKIDFSNWTLRSIAN